MFGDGDCCAIKSRYVSVYVYVSDMYLYMYMCQVCICVWERVPVHVRMIKHVYITVYVFHVQPSFARQSHLTSILRKYL